MTLDVDRAKFPPVIQNERLHREAIAKWINAHIDREYELNLEDFGAIGDGASHPLSQRYATLEEAQVRYPRATALTDEIDWAATQAAADELYTRSITGTNNFTVGKILAPGNYRVNRTIVFNNIAVIVEGHNPHVRDNANEFVSGFTYNGPDGTLDVPIYIFDFYIFTELDAAPPNRLGNSAAGGGGKFIIKNLLFGGKSGSMTGVVGNESGYISGIRIRKANFSTVKDCTFMGTLWDGIGCTDAQLFLTVEDCFFYGVYRDAINIHGQAIDDFSTTTWFYRNEFGSVGRYAILGDYSNSVEALPIIRDNSFEHTFNSYFVQNPEWFVHGVTSCVCIIQAGNLVYSANRNEGTTDATAGYWADLHIANSNSYSIIENSILRNLICTSSKASGIRTAAATTYGTTYGFYDITNERNFECGISGDTGPNTENLVLRNLSTLQKVFQNVGNNTGLSSSGLHYIENTAFVLLNIPVIAGTFATKVTSRQTAIVSLGLMTNFAASNATITSTDGFRRYFSGTRSDGLIRVSPGTTYGQWAANTAYSTTIAGENIYPFRAPLTENGFLYQITVAGTSGAAEPAWPTTIGGTVVDGTVTWTAVATVGETLDVGSSGKVVQLYNNTIRWTQSAVPSAGFHAVGEIWYNSGPVAGGTIGSVCTTAGRPGTWKTFGAIAA